MKNFLKGIFGEKEDIEVIVPVDGGELVRKFARATGRVQGVGFRYFVQQESRQLHVTGWVRNETDGSVTMELQGTTEQLDELITRIKKGNGFCKVESLAEENRDVAEGENKFGIKY